ncbi:MAG: family 16 glycosylhydrolase [Prevotella sp.]|nr:family 16 glycosylhydrolase [Prevotella sp.]
MKKIMIISAIFAIVAGLSACNGNDSEIGYAPAEEISLSQKVFQVDTARQTLNVRVKTSHEFSVYTSSSWLTLNPVSSIDRDTTLTITVDKNKGDARQGVVVVWAGGSRDSILISQAAGVEDIKAPIAGYKLVWNDEFEGSALGSDWTYGIQPAGWVNNEKQNYVNDNDVSKVSGGSLKINLIKNADGSYKSARVYAKRNSGWKYGYMEARIKLPKGKGTWPAFWMMPVNFKSWPADGEIDIMEHVGYNQDNIVSTIHCTKYNNTGTAIESANRMVVGATSEYHLYGMEWTSEQMTFYVDNVALLTYKNDGTGIDAWPFDNAFYIIFNLAYGGSWGGLQGVDDSALPATMEIDYVRVFQK